MKPIETSGADSPHQSAEEQQAEVADLAAKVLALHHRSHADQGGPPQGAAGRQTRRRHGWLWWAVHGMVGAVTVSLAAAVVLRVFYHDGTHLLTWINAFTRYVYLPAYLCLAWAVWQRRWVVAVLALTVVGFHVIWMAPNFLRDRRFDVPAGAVSEATDSPRVRILFANVLSTNRDYSPMWEEIAQVDPDVIVLAEFVRHSRPSLNESAFMAPFLNVTGPLRAHKGEVVVYSRLPVKAESQQYVTGRIVQTVDIDLGSETLRVIGLHAPRPMPPPQYDYYGYWRQMLPMLSAHQGPLVVVGDFNATEHSLVYKQLKDAGLRSAHDDRGRGYATTWPNGEASLPPIRIDHAFLSPELECERIAEGVGEGSDHKPLIVDVRLRTQAATRQQPAPSPD